MADATANLKPNLEIVTDRRDSCVHHWLLGEPAGGEVQGRCRHCRASRTFPSSPESTRRFDDYRELMAPTSYSARLSA